MLFPGDHLPQILTLITTHMLLPMVSGQRLWQQTEAPNRFGTGQMYDKRMVSASKNSAEDYTVQLLRVAKAAPSHRLSSTTETLLFSLSVGFLRWTKPSVLADSPHTICLSSLPCCGPQLSTYLYLFRQVPFPHSNYVFNSTSSVAFHTSQYWPDNFLPNVVHLN